MEFMEAREIRQKFLKFFEERGHKIVPSSSLIPDDKSVLLTTAGMQQFKKYYTEPSLAPAPNIVSVQKCFRTSDIDEVGDDSHLTFFEMLGNFSFGYRPGEPVSPKGGYFKKEAIAYAKDFLESLGLNIEYVAVFGGDEKTPPDEESYKIWQALGVRDIRKAGREDNFWGPTGKEGPCGPTTEIYIGGTEIWNIVFNEYYCRANGVFEKLKTFGVDTGMGIERLAMVSQNKNNLFETDLFAPLMELLPPEISTKHKRIIVDHLRGSAFLIADGVRPSNKEAGYILRRLMRRTFVYENIYKISAHIYDAILHDIVHEYGEFYPELLKENENIREEFKIERERFMKNYPKGKKYFDEEIKKIKIKNSIGGFQTVQIYIMAFELSTVMGIPVDIIKEWLETEGLKLDEDLFMQRFKKHQEISRAGVEKKFGGHGLILDTGELKAGSEEELKKVTRLHTATHLLNAALHKALGEEVSQRGSDITVERTRFDFLFPRKLTNEELKAIERLVNEAIAENYPVTIKEMPLEEAKQSGALFFYKGKYPERVKVYIVGNEKETFSQELCGGPHVSRTGEIGHFKILKEESSSAGVRRIRATVE